MNSQLLRALARTRIDAIEARPMHTAPPPQSADAAPAQACKDSRANRSTPPDPVREPPCLSAPARPLRVRHGIRNQLQFGPDDRLALIRHYYQAYDNDDRLAIEPLLHPGFTLTSPDDDRIDRAAYFNRCCLAIGRSSPSRCWTSGRTTRMPWSDTGRPSSTDQGSATSSTSNSPTPRYCPLTSTSGRNSADRARPGFASVSGLVPATSPKTSDEVIAYLENAGLSEPAAARFTSHTASTAQFRITRKST